MEQVNTIPECEVDPVTGEILPQTPEQVTLGNMPSMGRWIIGTRKRMDHLRNPRPIDGDNRCGCTQCNLARETKKHIENLRIETTRLIEEEEKALAIAEQFVAALGEVNKKTNSRFLYYKGTGRFTFRNLSPVLDSTGYDGLDEEARRHLQAQRPGCFDTKKIVTLDRRSVLQRVQEGDETLKQHFKVKTGQKFEFKPD